MLPFKSFIESSSVVASVLVFLNSEIKLKPTSVNKWSRIDADWWLLLAPTHLVKKPFVDGKITLRKLIWPSDSWSVLWTAWLGMLVVKPSLSGRPLYLTKNTQCMERTSAISKNARESKNVLLWWLNKIFKMIKTQSTTWFTRWRTFLIRLWLTLLRDLSTCRQLVDSTPGEITSRSSTSRGAPARKSCFTFQSVTLPVDSELGLWVLTNSISIYWLLA